MASNKYVELTGYNPISREGTVNWLKYEIKAATEEFNKRYRELSIKGEVPSQLEEEKDLLRTYSGKSKPKRQSDVLSAGVSGKNKAWLKRHYDELKRALKTDVWSDSAAETRTDKEIEAWKSFNSNQLLNWDFKKWKSMVDIFGHIDSEILRGFGYEDHSNHKGSSTAKDTNSQILVVEELTELPKTSSKDNVSNSSLVTAFSFAYDRGLDLYSIMERVRKNTYGQGKKQYEMIDELYMEIGRELKRQKGETP